MKLIVKYSLIFLLANSLTTYAQQQTVEIKTVDKKSSVPDSSIVWTRGVRLGCNLAPFILTGFQKDRKGFEFSIDTRLTPKLYPTFELGFENYQTSDSIIKYHSNGLYGRLGLDINLRDKDLAGNDIFFIGARYGFYAMQHRTDNYTVYDSIWGNVNRSIPQSSSYGQWIEILTGVKVEILNNFYLGWSLRSKFLINTTHGLNFPRYMPGFGNGANTVNFGVTYSIYYQIPLMKVRSRVKVKVVEPEEPDANKTQNPNQQDQMQTK